MWPSLSEAYALADRLSRTKGGDDLLALVYSWFTEGFDTADLQDAKALLENIRCVPLIHDRTGPPV